MNTNLYKQITFTLFFFILAYVSFAQKGNIGLGIKAGDPTGISAKFYGTKNPLELVVGRGYAFNGYYYNDEYYEERFYEYDRFSGKDYKFHRYGKGAPIVIQLHWLKQQPLKGYKGLDWYLGAGPQFRSFRVDYYYRDKNNNIYHERLTDYDLGVDGVIGMEYTFRDMPLSIFGDVNLFVELIDQPFLLSLQGGLGVRYNLK